MPPSITYTYDDLGRLTLKDMSGGPYGESDISYTYDNLSRLTSAHAANGLVVDYGYDALSRLVSDATVHGARTMQYDLAGNIAASPGPMVFTSPTIIW